MEENKENQISASGESSHCVPSYSQGRYEQAMSLPWNCQNGGGGWDESTVSVPPNFLLSSLSTNGV